MLQKRANNTDLILGKLGPQKSPGSGPSLPIKGKNAITKERVELLMSISQTKVRELGSQHCLDILRFPGD